MSKSQIIPASSWLNFSRYFESVVEAYPIDETNALNKTILSLSSLHDFIVMDLIDASSIDNNKLSISNSNCQEVITINSSKEITLHYNINDPCSLLMKFMHIIYEAREITLNHFVQVTGPDVQLNAEVDTVCVPDAYGKNEYYSMFSYYNSMYFYFPAIHPSPAVLPSSAVLSSLRRAPFYEEVFLNLFLNNLNASSDSESKQKWLAVIKNAIGELRKALYAVKNSGYDSGTLSLTLQRD